jgi:monoamine oxidase
MPDADVLVLGAGVAGLSAAVELAHSGIKVVLLEARDRIGGRILTQHDPATNMPVELGAEFIHGLPPEIWNIVQRENLLVHEIDGANWCRKQGELRPCEAMPEVDKMLNRLDDKGPDESFLHFLDRFSAQAGPDGKEWALSYVSGFHAADPALISLHSLVSGMRADEQVEGDRAFHLNLGYERLVNVFRRQLDGSGVPIHLQTIIENIEWSSPEVRVTVRSGGAAHVLSASRVLVTLPLGVLQAGSVEFVPNLPPAKQEALAHLAMGKVARVTLRFDERFWNEIRPAKGLSKTLEDASFLFSTEDWFPTWWTTMPLKAPIITGWSPATWAPGLAGQPTSFVIDKALSALGRTMEVDSEQLARRLQASYWHDWEADPFSRGAYSYVKVGGGTAQRDLGRPVDGKIFFAGEATDVSGHNGTVHGAIASGRRAVEDILRHR